MSETKHSPGPWTLHVGGEYSGQVPEDDMWIVSADGAYVGAVEGWLRGRRNRLAAPGEAARANAALICAAPDLLMACEAALADLATWAGEHKSSCDCVTCLETIPLLQAATARAKGGAS